MPRKFSRLNQPQAAPVKVIMPFTQLNSYLPEVQPGPFLWQQFSFMGTLTDCLLYIGGVSYDPSVQGKEIILTLVMELGTDKLTSKVLVKAGMNDVRQGFAFARGTRVTISLDSKCSLRDVWFSAVAKCRPRKNMEMIQVEVMDGDEDEGILIQDSERTYPGITSRLSGGEEHS